MPSCRDLHLGWCSHDAAVYAVTHWHYSKRIPKSKLNTVGVWERGVFVGAVVFGYGATPALVKPYGLTMHQGCELVRVALRRNHSTPVSRIVAIALNLLKAKNPGCRLVVSFADPSEGHHGGIYQAGGWIYSGRSADCFYYQDARGKIWHHRNVSEDLWRNGKQIRPSQCAKILKPGKYRYLMPLDREMRKRVERLAMPYPKRHANEAERTLRPLQGQRAV